MTMVSLLDNIEVYKTTTYPGFEIFLVVSELAELRVQ